MEIIALWLWINKHSLEPNFCWIIVWFYGISLYLMDSPLPTSSDNIKDRVIEINGFNITNEPFPLFSMFFHALTDTFSCYFIQRYSLKRVESPCHTNWKTIIVIMVPQAGSSNNKIHVNVRYQPSTVLSRSSIAERRI